MSGIPARLNYFVIFVLYTSFTKCPRVTCGLQAVGRELETHALKGMRDKHHGNKTWKKETFYYECS